MILSSHEIWRIEYAAYHMENCILDHGPSPALVRSGPSLRFVVVRLFGPKTNWFWSKGYEVEPEKGATQRNFSFSIKKCSKVIPFNIHSIICSNWLGVCYSKQSLLASISLLVNLSGIQSFLESTLKMSP